MLLSAWIMNGGQAVDSVESTCLKVEITLTDEQANDTGIYWVGIHEDVLPNFEVLPLGSKGNNITGEWVGYLAGKQNLNHTP